MSTEHRAMLSVLAAAMLWGTTGTAAAFASSLSAITVGAVAMGGGGLLQALVNMGALREHAPVLRREWPVVLIGSVCVALYPLAFYTSMRVGGVALGTVVSLASAPLASAVIERVIDGRRLGVRWAGACMLGCLGGTLLCLSQSGSAGSGVPAGVGLGLMAGVTYAGYSWALRRLLNRAVPRRAAAGAVLGIGGALLVPVALCGGAGLVTTPSSEWPALIYVAVVPMFLGYVLFSHGLGGVDATTATTITLVEPAVATVLAVAVLGEQLPRAGWIGMAVLCVALCVLALPDRGSRGAAASFGTDEAERPVDSKAGVTAQWSGGRSAGLLLDDSWPKPSE